MVKNNRMVLTMLKQLGINPKDLKEFQKLGMQYAAMIQPLTISAQLYSGYYWDEKENKMKQLETSDRENYYKALNELINAVKELSEKIDENNRLLKKLVESE